MNRKNTILIAVMINAGLLAVLLITALTTQEEIAPHTSLVADAVPPMPKFDDTPLFTEPPAAPSLEPIKIAELPQPISEEPLVHQLPPLQIAPAPVAAAAPEPAPAFHEVTVKKGDNLEKIAKVNRTTVAEIVKLNRLSNNMLKIGQVLKMPAEKAVVAAPKPAPEKKSVDIGPEYYTMKVGDNPWAIAMKHHIKVQELLRLNGLNEEKARKLKPGDRLRVR